MPSKNDESQMNAREALDTDSVSECAWERRFERGHVIRAYWVTIKEILFRPTDFFSKLAPSGPSWEPVLFALATIIVALLGAELWAMLKDWAPIDPSSQSSSLRMKIILGKFTLRDACAGASIVMIGAICQVVACHLALKRLCSTYQGFLATWRVYFYAQAAQIAYMLPFIGGAIGPVWYAIVLAVGLAEVHRSRIEIALFGPLVIAATTVLLRIILQLTLFSQSQMRIYESGLLWSWLLSWI
jgi:hypothetical protein